MLKKWIVRILSGVAILMALTPILAFAGWMITAWWSDTHPKSGVAVARVDWLPEFASNISFYKTYSYTAYEFDISEDGFRDWAGNKEMVEITEPVAVERYNFPDTHFPSDENTANISNALWWKTAPRGNGGGTLIAYDRDQGIAYFQDNPR